LIEIDHFLQTQSFFLSNMSEKAEKGMHSSSLQPRVGKFYSLSNQWAIDFEGRNLYNVFVATNPCHIGRKEFLK